LGFGIKDLGIGIKELGLRIYDTCAKRNKLGNKQKKATCEAAFTLLFFIFFEPFFRRSVFFQRHLVSVVGF
jgi:hypothetical protein